MKQQSKIYVFKVYLTLLFIFYAALIIGQTDTNIQPLSNEERETYIQEALKLRKGEDYFGAIQQLNTILYHNPSDSGALLFKGDLQLQSNNFGQAVQTYRKLLPMGYESTIVKINLSYALFKNHRPAKALNYARSAWQNDQSNPRAIINLFNALLWNIKTKEAGEFLEKYKGLLKPDDILVLKARLFTVKGNYKKGLNYYDSLSRTYPSKYYILEYSEVLLGKKEIDFSEQVMKKFDTLFTANEMKTFMNKHKASQLQNAGTEFVYFKDVGDNVRYENIVWWQAREGKTYRIRLSAGTTRLTSALNEKTSTMFGHLNIEERWNKAWTGTTDLHFQVIKPEGSKSFNGLTGSQTVKFQPNDRRMFGLVLSSEILSFTSSLLSKKIRSYNLGYVTHILVSSRVGIYSAGSAGILTDNNQRYEFFGSLYYLFRTEPTLKSGLNFSALHFADSTIKIYFSPNRFLSTEIFVDFTTPLPKLSKFYLNAQGAAGLQRIEMLDPEPAFRFQTELGFRLAHFEAAASYRTSNVASSSGTGYKFDWVTFRVLWKW